MPSSIFQFVRLRRCLRHGVIAVLAERVICVRKRMLVSRIMTTPRLAYGETRRQAR
jgi:hypothetical protein